MIFFFFFLIPFFLTEAPNTTIFVRERGGGFKYGLEFAFRSFSLGYRVITYIKKKGERGDLWMPKVIIYGGKYQRQRTIY